MAEISAPLGEQSYLRLLTAVVDPTLAREIVERPGAIGHEVDASGPPGASRRGELGDYDPRFWIFGGDTGDARIELEPLVLAWNAKDETILQVDPRFLMTYGLSPRRRTESGGNYIDCWDDVAAPRERIILAKAVSRFSFSLKQPAWVRVHRDYLQDYCSLRGKTLLQVFIASGTGVPDQHTSALLGADQFADFETPGHMFWLRPMMSEEHLLNVQAAGSRILLEPGESPITLGRWEYGELSWPGLGVVTDTNMPLMDLVYVRDEVLGHYEDRPEFEITPELGCVGLGHQWSVSHCHRVGRDLIQVEVRKLYEGTPPDVVQLWHRYAVEPPPRTSLPSLRRTPNVAVRSKRMVFGLIDAAESLSRLLNILGHPMLIKDMIGFDRERADYYGWWKMPNVEPITRHLPLGLVRDGLLDRCLSLHKVVCEPWPERI
ncbi:MAG: hypothetical protein ACE5FA_09185, partial [Dehalococcoidia bacterium]